MGEADTMIHPSADAIYEHMMELKEMMRRIPETDEPNLLRKKKDLARKIRHLQRRYDELTKMPWELI